MKILRFILPFLFEKNWYTGKEELSRPRCIIFGVVALALLGGVTLAFILQSPVEYSSS